MKTKLIKTICRFRIKNKMKGALISSALCLAASASSIQAAAPLVPWQNGAFESGKYRNLFAEMGYPQQAIDAKVDEIFHDLFEGPDKIYFEVGDSMAYISDIKNHDARTEGMSYGLMIAVQFDRKDIFDRLWRWGKKYMQHQDGPLKGYFAWSCKTDGTKNSEGPASDGELYYVTALIFASNRWGNHTGIDYLGEAQNILNCSESKKGDKGIIPLIHPEQKLITFVPTTGGGQFTDPSYHLPAFYEVWARWANDGRADYWRECARKSREYLHKTIHPVTGLNPDYSNYDGSLLNNGNTIGDAFRFDSWRVPMNIALDYSWACADKEWQQDYGNKIQNFLYSKGIDTFVDQYNVDGTDVKEILKAGEHKALRHSLGLVATSAAVSLVCNHEKSREFVDRLWNAKHVPYEDGYFDAYYDGLLRLFAFMHLSGRYQIIFPGQKADENGSQLWLRQKASGKTDIQYKGKSSATTAIALSELQRGWNGAPVILEKKSGKDQTDSFHITSANGTIQITSATDAGLLYGAYHLLRLQATGTDMEHLQVTEHPAYTLRILNHWDNLDGTIERGYAGKSLWNWDELPGTLSPRYEEYARANASIGINGTVVNNVNASSKILSADYIQKVKALADLFRPYGIKIYLSVNFSSPMQLDGLKTADPLNKEVIAWWKKKVKEIYAQIPDFGGFLVKANSEGQPGPCDFGRTHAEGANMMAAALKPYKGIVMWRAFVYSPTDHDRAKQAYLEFQPLDGKFMDNVIVQIKNGPIDFQPREPYSPLFNGMHRTDKMVEFQITQEYLGASNHLAYLAPMWKEFFRFVKPNSLKAMAGVANIGDDTNWCGHHFAQSNWYAFGRLAWNPELSSEQIADEWLQQTFTHEAAFVHPVKEMMVQSRETVVDYMMPLGLHHIFAWGHHYGPEPWCYIPNARPDWLPSYYHNADKDGIGFDRSSTGSNAVAQYTEELHQLYNDINTCPEEYLLWFHHAPWNHRMKSGRTLWDELCFKYNNGVQQTHHFQQVWDRVEKYVDQRRFNEVQSKLKIQARDAVWWKDACLLYFQGFSGMPIPYEIERPVHELQDMKDFKLKISNYECAPCGFNK